MALLCACAAEEPEGQVRIRFVTWKPNQPAVWERAIERFERAHPGILVERQVGPHSSTALHDLLSQKLKNRDPSVDVFFMDVVWPAEFAAAGWARPLDDRFLPEEQARFLPGTVRANRWGGRIYGVPAFIDAGLLYYRRDLLDAHGLEPPRTWPELVEQADRVVDAERVRNPDLVGFTGQFKQYEGIVCDMLEFIESGGGRLVDPETGRAAIAEPAALDAVRFVRDRLIGSVAPRSVLTYQEPESLAVFLQGDAVFHRNWPYAWEVSGDPERSRVVGRVGVAPLPHFAGGRTVAALGGWQYGISAFSGRVEPAWEFVRFMTSPETQRALAIEAALAPTRRALYSDPEVLARHPRFADQAAAFEAATPRPVTPVYPSVSEVLQRYFSAAISDPGSDLPGLAREASIEIERTLAMVR